MNSGSPDNKTRQVIATVAALLAVVLVVFGVKAFAKDDSIKRTSNITHTSVAASSSTEATAAEPTAATSSTSTTYKDGTYSSTGEYTSPGGTQSLGVSITIQDDKVAAATVTEGASDRNSEEFQLDFISGYKNLVIGKSIDDVHLSQVSGSSLTSQGFNNALEQIKAQAKS